MDLLLQPSRTTSSSSSSSSKRRRRRKRSPSPSPSPSSNQIIFNNNNLKPTPTHTLQDQPIPSSTPTYQHLPPPSQPTPSPLPLPPSSQNHLPATDHLNQLLNDPQLKKLFPQPIIDLLSQNIQQSHSSIYLISPHDLQTIQLTLCTQNNNNHLPSSSLLNTLCNSLSNQNNPPSLSKRSSIPDDHSHLLLPRQSLQGNGTGPSADGYPSCTAVSNAILSCFPESRTVLVQHTWSKFIWNNNYPTFIGSKFVDIYLFNANSETPVANWTSIANDRGMIGIYADDSWFPPLTTWQDGRNLTYPYFFIITTAGAALTGGEQHQATFKVVQTAPPAALVSASIASRNQLSASSFTLSPSPSATPNSILQHGGSDDSFPKWETALIVILGGFALFIFLIAAYLAFTNARKRRQVRLWQAAAMGGKSLSGGSVASHSPMIQNTEGAALIGTHKNHHHPLATSARDLHSPNSSRPGSPLSANVVPAGVPSSFAFPTTDRAISSEALATPDGPITSVDATIMADAFRKALRKPEFTLAEHPPGNSAAPPRDATKDQPGDEESRSVAALAVRGSMQAQVVSVDNLTGDDVEADEEEEAKEIMDRELASEGRSMTSVDNRKRPTVHG